MILLLVIGKYHQLLEMVVGIILDLQHRVNIMLSTMKILLLVLLSTLTFFAEARQPIATECSRDQVVKAIVVDIASEDKARFAEGAEVCGREECASHSRVLEH